MPEDQTAPVSLPPDIATYLKGAPPESRQFDFLIGEWVVNAIRYDQGGSPVMNYTATWTAQHLNNGRMVMDDFRAKMPTGQEISSFVTLRTYCETTGRWELAGLPAHQPNTITQWHGQWSGEAMVLQAVGHDKSNAKILNRIRFFNIEANAFDWESDNSFDIGETWQKLASLKATRMR